MSVMGVDACKTGWVGVVLDDPAQVLFAPHIGELVEQHNDLDVVAIDIPIGLKQTGLRRADEEARLVLPGRKRSSLFFTPPEPVLRSTSYEEANALSRRNEGKGISRQAWGLRVKILEVAEWVSDSGVKVCEAHPEISFVTMAGAAMQHSKKTAAGLRDRLDALRSQGIEVPTELGVGATKASADDIVDAAVVAWTAGRAARGVAQCYPDPPEENDSGQRLAIWA